MTGCATHRLDGLEPDNLLAFMALLGLLRVLEEARPDWRPRVLWTVDELPLRPILWVQETADETAIVEAASKGLSSLSACLDFDGLRDLTLPPKQTTRILRQAAAEANEAPYTADLWSALVSDAAMSPDRKKAEPTPLCLMFGQGHQHFLARLTSVPRELTPPDRGTGRKRVAVSEGDCLREALFARWARPDTTQSFRWDPNEDVRYALRARDPTDAKTKETTQHGANRLAAIGISALTVVPRQRATAVKLAIIGGVREAGGRFAVEWPIWREPISLACIRALLSHPHLDRSETRAAFGIVERRRARRISSGKFMNFTRANTVAEQG